MCPPSPKAVPLYSFHPPGLQVSPLYHHFIYKDAARPKVQASSKQNKVMGQKGMPNKGGRVVKDNTLFFMSARTCFTSVHTMKASNHTLHFFFSLSFESDIPNTKIRNCYQTPCFHFFLVGFSQNCSLLVRLQKVDELKGSAQEKANQKTFPSFLYKTLVKQHTCKLILLHCYCTCERKEEQETLQRVRP